MSREKIGIIAASTKFDPFEANAKEYYLNIYPNMTITKKQYESLVTGSRQSDTKFLELVYTLEGNYYVPNINKIRSNLKNEALFYEILMGAYCRGVINNQLFVEIEKLKEKTDFVIAYLHWGDEYIHLPANWQTVLGKKLVDLGCNLVVGCHSHTIQGVEVYRETPIFYSLGNYLFNSNNPSAMESIALHTEIDHKNKSIELVNYNITPYKYNPKLYYPVKLDSKAKEEVINKFDHYSELIGCLSQDDYHDELLRGISVSRKYKKLHVVQNIYRMGFKQIICIGRDYFSRRIRRGLRNQRN